MSFKPIGQKRSDFRISRKSKPKRSPTSMSSAAGSLARTSAPRARVLASLALEAASGTNSLESLMASVRSGSSSRTSQAARSGGLMPSDETWSGSVMRAYRSRFKRAISGRYTDEHESFSLPTLTTRQTMLAPDSQKWPAHRRLRERLLPTLTAARYGSTNNGSPHDGRTEYATKGTPSLDTIAGMAGGTLNPEWCEDFMGFPVGWTET